MTFIEITNDSLEGVDGFCIVTMDNCAPCKEIKRQVAELHLPENRRIYIINGNQNWNVISQLGVRKAPVGFFMRDGLLTDLIPHDRILHNATAYASN